MFGIRIHQGVNLLEMMVTLAIVVILVVVAVPSFISFTKEHRVTSTAQNLYYALQYARTEAIKRNQTVYVNFQLTDNWCYGINAGSTCNCSVANSCGLGTTTAPQLQQLVLSQTGLTNNTIQFEGTRGATTGASELIFTAYGQTTAVGVSITLLGNMSLCSSTVSGYSACP